MAGTGYEWLADLARLEWACEESVAAAHLEPAGLESLGRFDCRRPAAPGAQAATFVAAGGAPFPIWSVWQANQHEDTASPVDLDAGAEHCVVACVADRVAVYRIDQADHQLLHHLCDGMSLAEATDAAAADPDALGRLLAWLFDEELVVQVVSPSAPA